MNSSRPVRRGTGLRHSLPREFVGIDHGPAEPEVAPDIVTMASLGSAPVCSRKRVMRSPTLSFTTIEDDPDIAPVHKVSAQLFVPVRTAAGHYEKEHCQALIGWIVTD
jgi:hypothetical protein